MPGVIKRSLGHFCFTFEFLNKKAPQSTLLLCSGSMYKCSAALRICISSRWFCAKQLGYCYRYNWEDDQTGFVCDTHSLTLCHAVLELDWYDNWISSWSKKILLRKVTTNFMHSCDQCIWWMWEHTLLTLERGSHKDRKKVDREEEGERLTDKVTKSEVD